MTKKPDAPAIRFKGFSDAWEQRKLGELVDRVVRKNTNNESTLPLTISAQYGLVDQITYFNNRVASRDVSNYYLVLNGEFAYNKSTSDGYPFGAVKRLDLYEKGVLSTLYIVFSPKKEQQVDSDFLTVFFDTDRWHKGVAERAAEGARNHGLLNISAEDFFDIDLSVPKDVAEQKQIGAFIRQLDNLITLHQRKFEKLTNVKKSMLEKMFPQNGCSYPEIRFKGFTDAWEQRKLGDCFTERVESMPDGELISVTINDGIKKFSELGRHDNSNDDKSKYKKVCIGDIAYNSMRMWQGASGYSPYEGIVSPAYTVLSPNSGINSKCLAYQFKLPDMIHTFQINSQGITSDNWNLKYPALSEIKIFVSKDEKEQEQIAEYFTDLDHLITLHQRQPFLHSPPDISLIVQLTPPFYTFSWEQRKLEDYLTVSAEKNTGNIYGRSDVLSVSGDYGIVNQIEFQGRSFAGASVSNYGVVQTGDVVYTKSPLNSNPYGIIKTNKGKPGIVSTLYAVYHPKENAFSDFIQVYFEQHARMNNYMHPLVNKGAKNDMKVSAENALKGPVCFPSRIEQESISAFFSVLDNLITLHQRKPFLMKWRTSDANRNQTNRLVL